MSSRFSTSLWSRSASASMLHMNSCVSARDHSTSGSSQPLVSALIDASGVRRSWLTAASNAFRRSLACVRLSTALSSPCRRCIATIASTYASKRRDESLVVGAER